MKLPSEEVKLRLQSRRGRGGEDETKKDSTERSEDSKQRKIILPSKILLVASSQNGAQQ